MMIVQGIGSFDNKFRLYKYVSFRLKMLPQIISLLKKLMFMKK